MSRTLLGEILKLSVEERIAIADTIYNSLDAKGLLENKKLPGPLKGQRDELERRFAAYAVNPEIAIPIERTLARMKSHK